MMSKMRDAVALVATFLMVFVSVCIDADEYDDEDDL